MTEHPQQDSGAAPAAMRNNRIKLLMVFAIGILPMVGSFFLYQHYAASSGFSTRNQGQLVQPPLAWAELDAAGERFPGGKDEGPTWKLVLVVPDNCAATCRGHLDTLRAMHLLLTKDAQRVRRVVAGPANALAATSAALAETYPRLQFATMADGAVAALGQRGVAVPGLLVVDPIGNLALTYSGEQIGKPLQKDLKHLLKTSRIG